MHERCERYIKGEIGEHDCMHGDKTLRFGDKRAAVIHTKFLSVLDAYKNHPNGDRGTEKKIAFDKEWSLCSWKSEHARCVAVLDAFRYGGERGSYDTENRVLRIAEWKSGRPKDTHADQRSLYALFGLRLWLASTAYVTTYYLEDTAPPARLTTVASDIPKLKAIWMRRAELMERDKMCAPRPGYYCSYCDYSRAKGGPCIF